MYGFKEEVGGGSMGSSTTSATKACHTSILRGYSDIETVATSNKSFLNKCFCASTRAKMVETSSMLLLRGQVKTNWRKCHQGINYLLCHHRGKSGWRTTAKEGYTVDGTSVQNHCSITEVPNKDHHFRRTVSSNQVKDGQCRLPSSKRVRRKPLYYSQGE